jgi:hypothetical protein
VRLVGWGRLVGGQGPALLRVAVATALMGAAVYLARDLHLGVALAIGVATYGTLLLALRAVDLRELRGLGRALLPQGRVAARRS